MVWLVEDFSSDVAKRGGNRFDSSSDSGGLKIGE